MSEVSATIYPPSRKPSIKTLEIGSIKVDLWRGTIRVIGDSGQVIVIDADTFKTINEWIGAMR